MIGYTEPLSEYWVNPALCMFKICLFVCSDDSPNGVALTYMYEFLSVVFLEVLVLYSSLSELAPPSCDYGEKGVICDVT